MLTIMIIAWKKVTEKLHRSELIPSRFTGPSNVRTQTYMHNNDYKIADFSHSK